jgi:hypothetical protein
VAFQSRGQGDFLGSHDLEDFVAVVDGRAEIMAEVQSSEEPLRSFLAKFVQELLNTRAFVEALPGHPEGQAGRLPIIQERLDQLASL